MVMYDIFYVNDNYKLMETIFNRFKRYNYDKLIGIIEFSEQIAIDCFSNPFTTDTRTPYIYIYIYLSLMRSIMEIQFLLAVPFMFPVQYIIPHISALCLTSLSTVLHLQPLLWKYILLFQIIVLKKR